jgi:hypothetical protein
MKFTAFWDIDKDKAGQHLRRRRERGGIAPTHSRLDGGEWIASRPGRTLHPMKGPTAPVRQEAE